MKIIQFIFPFLFMRNWHTGKLELSRPRLWLLLGAVSFVILFIFVAYTLQAPVEYGVVK